MDRSLRFRAWIKQEGRMEHTITLTPWHITDCDRLMWKLEDVEVMQFTGLHDKNGKEIYEGDILRTHDGDYVVTWDKYQFILPKYYHGSNDVPYDYFSEQGEDEVIGNVYENPDLI